MGIPSEIYSLPASTPNLNFFLVYPYYQTFIRGECVLIKQLAKKKQQLNNSPLVVYERYSTRRSFVHRQLRLV